MYLRTFSTVLVVFVFGVIGFAQDELKVSFEPAKYPVTRSHLWNVKATNTSTQAIEAKILFEVKNSSDKVLYSWLAPNCLIPTGTQMLQVQDIPGMSFTSDNIHTAQHEDKLAVFVTATITSQYGYSEKTTIYKFPAQSFDFNSQFPDHVAPAPRVARAADDLPTKSETSTPPTPPTVTTTTIPNQIPDYTAPSPPPSTRPSNNLLVVPEKMNVFYIGVDNPLKITGVDDFTTVTCDQPGISIRPSGSEYFSVTANRPGEYTLKISTSAGESQQMFRAKRIPDPVAYLSDKFGGDIGAGQFRTQAGVLAVLKNFDFDANCQTTHYTIWRIQIDGTRTSVANVGSRFSVESQQLVNLALPGDIYIFEAVQGRCPGDSVNRDLHGMTFFIK